jgi:hypothetical protein
MKFSMFLNIALAFALGLAFTLDTAAAPVQALDLGELRQRHEQSRTADTNVNAEAAAAAAKVDTPTPTTTFSLISCPTNRNPGFGHGPVCSKTAKKPQPLDFGLGP